MMKVLAIALNTFREAIRNKILYSVILFAFFILLVATLFASVSIGSMTKVIKDFGLFSLSFFGALLSIVAGVSLLNKELKQKTIYNILSKPISRQQFILGKFIGLASTVSILVLLMGICLVIFSAVFEKRIDYLLFQGVYFAILEVFLVAAITMLFSSIVITTTLTALFTLGTYLAGKSITYLNYFIQSQADYPPFFSFAAKTLHTVLPDFSVLNFANTLVYGQSASLNELLYAAGYSLTYSAVCLIVAGLIFELRELN